MDIEDVQAGGARVRVRRWGDESRTPLFYWHGGGGGDEETRALAPPLLEAGYALYALDAPGYGDSDSLEPDAYAPFTLAETAVELLDRLGLAPAIWIGYSWGATIGVHTAARFPSSIRGLALLDGGYLVAQDDPDYDPETDYEDELEALRVRAEAGASWDAPHEVIGAAMVASRKSPCPPLYATLRATGISVLLAHATEPRELDAVRRPAVERFRSGLPEAEVVAIPRATHGILQDNAPEVMRVLLAWLDERG